jgi:hypothetical protein
MDAVMSRQIRLPGKSLVALSEVASERPSIHVVTQADLVIVVHELQGRSPNRRGEKGDIGWGGSGDRRRLRTNGGDVIERDGRQRGAGWRRDTTGTNVAFRRGSDTGAKSVMIYGRPGHGDERSAYECAAGS